MNIEEARHAGELALRRLAALGTEAAAGRLMGMGLRGLPGAPRACILAVYLTREVPLPEGREWVVIPPHYRISGEIERHSLPPTMNTLARAHDQGAYPELDSRPPVVRRRMPS
jgi:hypothetical protein